MHVESQRSWLAAAREDTPEEWRPRGRRDASSVRRVVLLTDPEKPAGNRAQFSWDGLLSEAGSGKEVDEGLCHRARAAEQLGILSSRRVWPSGPVTPLGRKQPSLLIQPLRDLGRNKVSRYLRSGFYPCPLGLVD